MPICAAPACASPPEQREAAALRCSRCKAVVYCSRDCQRAHWKAHKPNCGAPANPAPAPAAAGAQPGPELPCGHCDAAGARLRCTRCREAVYCNRECQRAAWRAHKSVCGKAAGGEAALQLLRRADATYAEEPAAAAAMARQARDTLPRESVPLKWAGASATLARALFHQSRREGDDELLEASIEAFEEALEELKPETDPVAWADTLDNMGSALAARRQGSRAGNREAAIRCWRDALRVTTKRRPDIWGEAYTNLGLALVLRASEGGERTASVEDAVTALTKALTVFPRDRRPGRFARASGTLGRAYLLRVHGHRPANVAKAREHLEQAREVMGGRAGAGAADLLCNLADALLAQGDDVAALAAFEAARDADERSLRARLGVARLGLDAPPAVGAEERARSPRLWADAHELQAEAAAEAGDWGAAVEGFGAARAVRSAAAYPHECVRLSAALLRAEAARTREALAEQAASRAALPAATREALAESDGRLWDALLESARREAPRTLANAAALGTPAATAPRLVHTAFRPVVQLALDHSGADDAAVLLEHSRRWAAHLALLPPGGGPAQRREAAAWAVLHRVAHEHINDQARLAPKDIALDEARAATAAAGEAGLLYCPAAPLRAADADLGFLPADAAVALFFGASCLVRPAGGDGGPWREWRAPEDNVGLLCAIVGEALITGRRADEAELAELLGVAEWREWLGSGARRVLALPSGPLWGVPLARLLPGLDVRAAPSLAVARHLSGSSNSGGGDPVLYAAYARRPHASQALAAASRAWAERGAEHHVSKASPDKLLASAKLRGASALLLACQAPADAEDAAGLYAGAGMLELRRVANELRLDRCEVAVVTGCALEAGQVAAALAAAGARSVVVVGVPASDPAAVAVIAAAAVGGGGAAGVEALRGQCGGEFEGLAVPPEEEWPVVQVFSPWSA